MGIHKSLIFLVLAVANVKNDAFTTRVKRYAPVEFETSARATVIYFDFLGQEYVVDLEPNHAAFHQTFKVLTEDRLQIIPRDEYIGTVREPRPGKGVLTQLEDNAYIGTLYFDDETLHLDPAYPHGLSKDVGKVIGYFGSDVQSNLSLSTHPINNQVSFGYINSTRKNKREVEIGRQDHIPDEKLNRCSLKLVADYSFFSTFGKNNTGIVTKFLVNMIARVNEIYTPINWDYGKEKDGIFGRGRFRHMGFSIKEIKVLDRPNASDSHYNSYSKLWHSKKLLEAFAFEEGSRDFCLVHLVTARKFKETSWLGAAYISYKTWDDGAGGICSKRETINGKMTYMNVLITTFIGHVGNSTYPLITKEIDFVVSHEYGHAWGAEDDPTIESADKDVEDCSPQDKKGGKYVMSAHLQMGYDPNNILFSPCSMKPIREVLVNKWEGCFEEEMTSFCGNGVVEDGEECDNGVETDEQEVSCCDKFCRLNVGAQCSPLNHICCTPTCQFHNSSHVCLPGDSLLCKADAVCNGFDGDCPPAPPVEDGIACFEDGECSNGICLPFCEKKSIGKRSCICEDLDLSCRKCCRDQNGTCSPVDGFKYLRDGLKCSKGTCRNKKCVNEVVDNVRIYFLLSFRSKGGLLLFLKNHIVGIAVFIITVLYGAVYWIVRCNESKLMKLRIKNEILSLRQVYISAEEMKEILDGSEFFI